ncbi:MAG: hypothetical protein CME31_21690 [Gimesia sp.]|uniref:Uncharacterized protein n=1 Tax=Gimesia maris TaxID=122 RepID=A0A3D3R9A9_9PLAN|nr:hypothetical protein [Gimesia sp.]HCO24672.1 hypothetical protein [Gimesia maris]|tara:strand:- start:101390 stop:101590 length:201 start_codon:yes stop_codon:yes gene_type:complete
MIIQINLLRGVVQVREITEQTRGDIRLWDDVIQGGFCRLSGLSFNELVELGDGIHDLEQIDSELQE